MLVGTNGCHGISIFVRACYLQDLQWEASLLFLGREGQKISNDWMMEVF